MSVVHGIIRPTSSPAATSDLSNGQVASETRAALTVEDEETVMERTSYSSPGAVEAAIASAAQRATKANPHIPTHERIRREYFNRFLSRVFRNGSESDWVLAGGGALLSRLDSARSTTDVDLGTMDTGIEGAVEALRELASYDLGDFFRFRYRKQTSPPDVFWPQHRAISRLSFEVFLGAQSKGTLRVDVAGGVSITSTPELVSPAHSLNLPLLKSFPYLLYPVVDHIADKVCATLSSYNGHPSTREKDLVDLVVLATTQKIDGSDLWRALRTESELRGLRQVMEFAIPSGWGSRYEAIASKTPGCHVAVTIKDARVLTSDFLNPALNGSSRAKTWSPDSLSWS